MIVECGTEICVGIHDRKLTFLPLGTTWHKIRLGNFATVLWVRRNGGVEKWICAPRGNGYMAPMFRQVVTRKESIVGRLAKVREIVFRGNWSRDLYATK